MPFPPFNICYLVSWIDINMSEINIDQYQDKAAYNISPPFSRLKIHLIKLQIKVLYKINIMSLGPEHSQMGNLNL